MRRVRRSRRLHAALVVSATVAVVCAGASGCTARPDDGASRVTHAADVKTFAPTDLDLLVGPELAVEAPLVSDPRGESNPGIGASASAFYVAWIDTRRRGATISEQNADVYGARLDPSTGRTFGTSATSADEYGVRLVSSIFSYPPLADIVPPQSPVVASNGHDFLVAVEAGGAISAVRVSGDTGLPFPLDGPGIAVAFTDATVAHTRMDAAFGGGMYILGWSDGSAAHLARIDPTAGTLLDPGGVTVAPDANQEQVSERLGCGGPSCVVTWFDQEQTLAHVARFDPTTGKALPADAAGPVLGLPASATVIGVVWDPPASRYAILSSNGEGAFVSLYDPTTGALSTAPGSTQVTTDSLTEGDIAFDGTRLIASWQVVPNGSLEPVRAAVIDASTLAVGMPLTPLEFSVPSALGGSGIAAVNGTASVVGVDFTTSAGEALIGTRIDDASGAIVGTEGVSIIDALASQTSPAIASSANGSLVAWADTRNEERLVVARRLDKNGAVTRAAAEGDIVFGASAQASVQPAVASDGTDYLVVYHEDTVALGHHLAGARIDGATGAILATLPPIAVETGVPSPAVVFDGTNYAVAIAVGGEVLFARLDAKTLAVIGAPTVLRPASPEARGLQETAIAYGDGTYLVAWSDVELAAVGTPTRVSAARFDASGVVLPSDAESIHLSNSGLLTGAPAITFANHAFFAAWDDARAGSTIASVYGRIVPVSGALDLTTPDIAIGVSEGALTPNLLIAPAVVDAGDGLSVEVVWSGVANLYSALVSYAGVVRDEKPLVVAAGASDIVRPAVARSGPGAMVVAYARPNAKAGDSYQLYTRTLATGPVKGACKVADDCASRYCVDGYCCDSPCNAACETCSATPGTCTPVTLADDADSCKGDHTCSAVGTCGAVLGTLCARGTDCASGNCVDQVCCESACAGGCDVCNVTPGKCTLAAAGTSGSSPACTPSVCDGMSASCPTTCKTDDDCERSYTCSVGGTCELLAGATCVDHGTLLTNNGSTRSCAPFACEVTACRTSCQSIEDCADGLVCDESHACVKPEDLVASGCATVRDDDGSTGSLFVVAVAGLGVVARRRRRARSKTGALS